MIKHIAAVGSSAALMQGSPLIRRDAQDRGTSGLGNRSRSMPQVAALLLGLAAGNALAQDTTPFQCERLTIVKTGSWVAPILRDFCEKQEASNGQTFAKLLGKPRPSTQVYLLPSYGSAEAARTGLACVGGTAMRRLANGWEQLRDRQHNWVRCRDLSET